MSMETRKMQTVLMDVSPQQATRWLEGNVRNRKIDQLHVNRMVVDMTAGRWKTTHQGIAFSDDGVLADGQHRLWAILLSNCTIPMMVSFNVPKDSIEYVDGGKGRTSVDRMNISGQFDGGVDKRQIGILRAMLRGLEVGSKVNFSDEVAFMHQYKKAILFACTHLPASRLTGVSSASVAAVVARAWFSVDHIRLTRFCEILKTGMTRQSSESVVKLLRDSLTSTRGRAATFKRQIYGKTERALIAYIKGEGPGQLYMVNREMFALPHEAAAGQKVSA